MDVTTLQCGCTIEWMTKQNVVTKRVKYATALIKLLRNEFRDLFLHLESGKIVHKFVLQDVSIHKKFVTEGKASIHFNAENAVMMFYNAPSANLIPFLKTLFIKLTSKKQSPKVKLREQLLSGKAHVLDEVSPVNSKDVNRVRSEIQSKESNMTSLELKRKRTIEALKSKQVSVT